MLKKFTDFTNEKKEETPKVSTKKSVQKIAKVNTPKVKDDKQEVIKEPKSTEPKMENFDFMGKIVKFPSNIKPSVSIVMLENNNVSKEKLHYIISAQTPKDLVVLKYNEKVELKLTEFITTMIEYYKQNENLKNVFDCIVLEGNESFSIIKNIPDVMIGERKLIQVLNDDIMKLLK